jgi:hypothetical protein
VTISYCCLSPLHRLQLAGADALRASAPGRQGPAFRLRQISGDDGQGLVFGLV